MSIPQGKFASPDPRYPFVGEAYQRQGGEVKGYVYDPYTDKYYIDPEAYKQQQIAQGVRKPDPKTPGIFEQYAPVIGGVAAASAAKALGQKIPGYLSSAGKQIGGLFGLGGKATGATAGLAGSGASAAGTGLAQTAAANAAYNAGATAAGGGLSGVGGAATAAKGAASGTASASGGLGGVGGAALPALAAIGTAANIYNYGGRKVLSGDADKADYLDAALGTNPITGWINPVFDAIGLGSVGEAFGLDRKTHKDYAAENYGKALKTAATEIDKAAIEHFYKNTLDNIEDKAGTGAVYQEGPLAGRKWKWDEVKNALDGSHFVGEIGFFQQVPDWMSGFTDEQRRELANAALDNNLLSHSKDGRTFQGENATKFKELVQQMRDGTYTPLKSEEQREAERQEFLAKLNGGDESPEVAGIDQLKATSVNPNSSEAQSTGAIAQAPEGMVALPEQAVNAPLDINTRPLNITNPQSIDPGFNLTPDHPQYKEIMELINQVRS